MTYDEFSEKLRIVKFEFRRATGREMETVQELEEFLMRRMVSVKRVTARGRKGALKSLKGLNI
jgi:hypothetical protein